MNGQLPKRAGGSGPCIKASNLSPTTTGATLKEALQLWGVTGIEEVVISSGRSGPIALLRFKTDDEADLMMLANGVEVDGMPIRVEYLPAAPAIPRRVSGRHNSSRADPPRKAQPYSLMKVTGLPKNTGNEKLVTFLRSYGVLGLAEVLVNGDVGLVRFHAPQNVEAAIGKADGVSMEGNKLYLRAIGPAEWRELEAGGSAETEGWDGEEDQGGYDGDSWEASWGYPGGNFGVRHTVPRPRWMTEECTDQAAPPGGAGLGGQKQPRGVLGGVSASGAVRARPGSFEEGGGSSSAPGIPVQQAWTEANNRGYGQPDVADSGGIPAAFRNQAAARRATAFDGAENGADGWGEDWEPQAWEPQAWEPQGWEPQGWEPQGRHVEPSRNIPRGLIPPSWEGKESRQSLLSSRGRPDAGWEGGALRGEPWGYRSAPY